jgi:hypothetical protein
LRISCRWTRRRSASSPMTSSSPTGPGDYSPIRRVGKGAGRLLVPASRTMQHRAHALNPLGALLSRRRVGTTLHCAMGLSRSASTLRNETRARYLRDPALEALTFRVLSFPLLHRPSSG